MSSQSRVQEMLQTAKAVSKLGVRDIAKKAGIAHGTVSNYLNDVDRTHPISEAMLAKLAKGFDVPLPRLRAAHYADRGLIPAEGAEPTNPGDVVGAILADPHLLPEAKEHLARQYALLLRVRAAENREQATEALHAVLSDEVGQPVHRG